LARPLYDPQMLPVDSVGGEPPLDAERLAPAGLRACFMRGFPSAWLPEDEFAGGQHRSASTLAAVLIPVIDRAEGPQLLLTRRSEQLTDHPGQISLPGGRAEASDASPVETALRETEEEIGLARASVQVLGSLPHYFTRTGYQITPVVGIVEPPLFLRPDPLEVSEIFEVPLAFLMNGGNHQRRTAILPDGSSRSFYTIPYESYFIWGVTAGMLRNLYHFLRT
jgi:8-oxo-dGTP pyrophosphatase MutT (NUDIX family)